MTDPPNPNHKSRTSAVVSTDGTQPAEQRASNEDGKGPAGFGLYLQLLGERSVPVVLIALGLSMVAADDELDVSRIPGWGDPQYVGMLAFAALLVLLGCVERIVQLRSPRGPLIKPPPRRTNGRRRVDRRKPPERPAEGNAAPTPPPQTSQ